MATKFLRAKAVQERLGCGRVHLWRVVKAGQFPAPVKLSPRMTVWPENEVDAWIEAKIAESRKPKKAKPAATARQGAANAPI
jgi:prophage regulatory protein